MTLVVDASAMLYLLASERGIAPFADLGLASPALLWSEVTSVLSEMRWRGELSPRLAQIAFDRLLESPVTRHAGEALYRDAQDVARELGWVKTYDAEYVALARRLDVELMSRDERLRRAAGRLVTIVAPDQAIPPPPSTGE